MRAWPEWPCEEMHRTKASCVWATRMASMGGNLGMLSWPRKLVSVLFSLNLKTQRRTVRARPRAQEGMDTELQPVPEMPALCPCSASGCSFHWAKQDKVRKATPLLFWRPHASTPAKQPPIAWACCNPSWKAPNFLSFPPLALVSTVIFLDKDCVMGQKCWNLTRVLQGGAGWLSGPWVLERHQTKSLSPVCSEKQEDRPGYGDPVPEGREQSWVWLKSVIYLSMRELWCNWARK